MGQTIAFSDAKQDTSLKKVHHSRCCGADSYVDSIRNSCIFFLEILSTFSVSEPLFRRFIGRGAGGVRISIYIDKQGEKTIFSVALYKTGKLCWLLVWCFGNMYDQSKNYS